ncbi:LOW QUALITY PROTEIN: C2 calcium-dependent domain-containing protein 4A [Canis lupus dingo]|uniref:LOW QUALITY PROTEIN: C2 calcium-dependent domain-containing protein 4A n=1 Tax=Canis lupus dingo TaxID=286419 RepID=UPI0020C5531E|nr:LOW QUALITY PROTEIN: C2 calcium-dependent domain-containing protein 4A [Canis lupus dingo]
MWCLDRLRLGPERLRRGRNGAPQGRAHRLPTLTPAAWENVLTPDRIPEFCIPPRLAPCTGVAALRVSWSHAAALDAAAGHTDWDPRSQAALSLPHLPRGRTAYGFCALLESPHTRRKESLFLGGPGAAPPRPAPPRAQPRPPPPPPRSPPAPARPRPAPRAPAPPARARRLLRAPEGLLSRALRARGSRGLARARSACGGDRDEPPSRAGAPSASASPSPSPSPPPSPPPPPGPDPRPERLEAEGTVALGRAGGALRLAAEYSRASGRLRVRLLGAEGRAAGAGGPRAVGCRVSFVLRPPGQTRPRRSAVVRPSRAAASEQDVWLDGLSEEQLRRLAVRVQAEERGRLRGQGELLLGALLLPAGPGLRPPPRA